MPAPVAPSVPPGLRIYAIGDIHGESGALDRLHALAADDAEGWGGTKMFVYLGDYVDRGDDSAGVIERLAGAAVPGFERRFLLGNHDAAMLGFLDDPAAHAGWLGFGGLETLASYGIRVAPHSSAGGTWLKKLSEALTVVLPSAHRAFLEGLELTVAAGDYLFVHAGVRPGRPLERQDADDLLWIREPFLSSIRWHGKRIVHGHTIVAEPKALPNRIAVDTGAYAGGALSCAVLEGASCRFIGVQNRV